MSLVDIRRQLRAAISRVGWLDETVRQLRNTDQFVALNERLRRLELRLAPDAETRTEAATGTVPLDGPASLVNVAVSRSVAPFLTFFPPGHFYSPVPDLADVHAQAERLFAPRKTLPAIDLHENQQVSLFRTLASLAQDANLPRKPSGKARYSSDNDFYGIGDALMLVAMLRYLRPRHYLEVGSGFTTALALDVNETFLDGSLSIVAIEPYPETLTSLLRPDDDIEILAQPVQSVPLHYFESLEANDILFIDSSHILRAGSDVHFLITTVLSLLAEGVHVHFHDIFWPFEYPRQWIEQGRAWNEDYLLHAFLMYNSAFEIVMWNGWMAANRAHVIAQELPAMLENSGGALWLRRNQRATSQQQR